MTDICGIPYTQATFDKEGKLLSKLTVPAETTDLVVVSHGWNNSEDDALNLYSNLFCNLAPQIKDDPAYKDRKVAVVGVIWPAKKFNELMTGLTQSGAAQAGGAQSLGDESEAEEARKAAEQAMHEAIDRAAPAFDDAGDADRLKTLHDLVPQLEADSAAQASFVETLRALLDPQRAHADQQHDEDSSDALFNGQPEEIFANAGQAAPLSASSDPIAAAAAATPESGGAKSIIGDFFSKAAHGVTNLLNVSTYFEMKQRAGTVGEKGVAPLIDQLADAPGTKIQRVHLVGHSFGGRVVAATALNSKTKKLHSLSLLQAAFSHNGFSRTRGGFFREVVKNARVNGPILVTHTKNDTAVGLAYPAASRISGDTAKAFGGPDDKFGGIGSNGAQQMDDGEIFATTAKMLPVGGAYQWSPGKFHNLDSTPFIIDPKGGDAHGFVFVKEVAWAISRAIIS